MTVRLPAGWPTGVHPPGSERFEETAVAWLFDIVPPDYRLYGVLRRYPLALAHLALQHVRACADAAREGYHTVRTDLGESLPPHACSAVLVAYRREGRRLAAATRAVELIEQALRSQRPPS